MNTRSLSLRLVSWYAGVLTLVFVLLGRAHLLIFLRHYLEANVLDNQARRARQIADTLVAHIGRRDEALLGNQVEDLYSPAGQRPLHPHHARRRRRGLRLRAPREARFEPAAIPPAPAGGPAARKIALPERRAAGGRVRHQRQRWHALPGRGGHVRQRPARRRCAACC